MAVHTVSLDPLLREVAGSPARLLLADLPPAAFVAGAELGGAATAAAFTATQLPDGIWGRFCRQLPTAAQAASRRSSPDVLAQIVTAVRPGHRQALANPSLPEETVTRTLQTAGTLLGATDRDALLCNPTLGLARARQLVQDTASWPLGQAATETVAALYGRAAVTLLRHGGTPADSTVSQLRGTPAPPTQPDALLSRSTAAAHQLSRFLARRAGVCPAAPGGWDPQDVWAAQDGAVSYRVAASPCRPADPALPVREAVRVVPACGAELVPLVAADLQQPVELGDWPWPVALAHAPLNAFGAQLAAVGGSVAAWETLFSLSAGWDATVGELVATVRRLTGAGACAAA